MRKKSPIIFPKISKNTEEKGFTLIEVLVAISILCFGLLGIAVMQTSAIRGNSLASDVTEGTVLAGEQLEALMRMAAANYDDASCLLDTTGDADTGLNDTGNDADYKTQQGPYLISWNVSIDSPLANTKTVNVIVSWKALFGDKRVSIQHIIPKV